MILSDVKTWDDVLSGEHRLRLTGILNDRESTYALLERIGTFTTYQRDEPRLLELMRHIALHAHWVGGEIHIAVLKGRRLGSCSLMLMSCAGEGLVKDVLKKVAIPVSPALLQEAILADPRVIEPLRVDSGSRENELLLVAPRLQSIMPAGLTNTVRGDLIRGARPLAPPRIPHDMPVPTSRPPPPPSSRTAIGAISLKKRPPPPPLIRPQTGRPPPPPSDAPPGAYSAVRPQERETPTIPEKQLAKMLSEESAGKRTAVMKPIEMQHALDTDLDKGWDD